MFTVLTIYNLTTWQRFLVAPFRALWERGASYRLLRLLRSLTGGYACVALRAVNAAFGGNGVAEASRLRISRALPACDGEDAAATPSRPLGECRPSDGIAEAAFPPPEGGGYHKYRLSGE